MKNTIKVTLASALLCTVAVGCQPEKVEPITVIARESESYRMYYSIDGAEYHSDISGALERSLFFDQMIALARQGYTVTVGRTANLQSTAKETVTFTTTDPTEAKQWANDMATNGYIVTINYDPDHGIYTCIATR
jgi:hypothetical protein